MCVNVEASIDRLAGFLEASGRVVVLTGAGCSTESGIPDYRDANGEWKHARPVMYQQFVGSEATRQRYWARSLVGWRRISHATPNRAHLALARLEAAGFVSGLLTQNVDGLHTRAGSADVVDLHGRLDTDLARTVARQLMKKDALTAHARDELGLTAEFAARPLQAAMASAATFAVGASVPVLTILFAPLHSLVLIISNQENVQ